MSQAGALIRRPEDTCPQRHQTVMSKTVTYVLRGHIALLKRKNVLWTCGICNTTLLDLRTPRYTHTRLTAFFPGLPRWAGTRKVKPIWILLKQETVSGSGISWAICKSALHSRQITTPAPHHSVFTGRMPFLLPNQQRQSTEGTHHVT